MGLTEDVTAALAKPVWCYGDGLPDEHVRQAGLDPFNPAIRQAVHLADELIGFPRHLSQHVGGFVLTREPLDETVPIGNAAMEDRTFIEWDKAAIDTLHMMKADLLALGSLGYLRRGLVLLQRHDVKNELEDVLKRELGVPLFQEQAMQIAITAAKFTPDEADGLRRAMATFRHNGNVHLFRDKFINGMTARGYDKDFAENCFGQIEGFGEYGFHESHATS